MNNTNNKKVIRKYKNIKYPSYKYRYKLIWTALWMLFIFGLCIIFKDSSIIWLLLIWGIGVVQ